MKREEEQNAMTFLKQLELRTLRDRQQLIDLLVNCRDNGPVNADLMHLQNALDRLEGVSHALTGFRQTATAARWEGA